MNYREIKQYTEDVIDITNDMKITKEKSHNIRKML